MRALDNTPEVAALIRAGAPIAVGVSGGKDSHAVAWALACNLQDYHGPEDGNREVELDMHHAVTRQLLDLFRSGGLVVEAPFHNYAGCRDMTQIEFADEKKMQVLYRLLDQPGRRHSYPLLDGVEINCRGDNGFYIYSNSLPSGAYIVDWAVEKFGATVDTRKLLQAHAKLTSQAARLAAFMNKYVKPDDTGTPAGS